MYIAHFIHFFIYTKNNYIIEIERISIFSYPLYIRIYALRYCVYK